MIRILYSKIDGAAHNYLGIGRIGRIDCESVARIIPWIIHRLTRYQGLDEKKIDLTSLLSGMIIECHQLIHSYLALTPDPLPSRRRGKKEKKIHIVYVTGAQNHVTVV